MRLSASSSNTLCGARNRAAPIHLCEPRNEQLSNNDLSSLRLRLGFTMGPQYRWPDREHCVNNQPDLSCKGSRRRGDVRTAPLFGIDFIDVSDDQLTLEVFFLGKAPAMVLPANVLIDGGRSIRDIKANTVRLQRNQDPGLDDSMEIALNKSGDFSTYTLRLVKLDDQ